MQENQDGTEQEFARRLRNLRRRMDMSQAVLANTLTVGHGLRMDDSAIARLEGGNRSIRLGEAVAIAKVFGLSLDEMLRPALPIDEQVSLAQQRVLRTQWLAAEALGEHAAAKAQLERLQGEGGSK